MGTTWRLALQRQFGRAIDALETALRTCPDDLWEESLWEVKPDDAGVQPTDRGGQRVAGQTHESIQVLSAFWYLAYHSLFFLDFYLSGGTEQEGFVPPAPFSADEHDAGVLPKRMYTRAELLTYLAHNLQKCQTTIEELQDEQVLYRWGQNDVSFVELLLVNMRHVQEHAAQLNMFLGQRVFAK